MENSQGGLYDLKRYECVLFQLAKKSSLDELPHTFRSLFTPVSELYDWVRIARNDALHQGAFARHLTRQTIKLAIILEDAVKSNMAKSLCVSDLMVENPICAEAWQPIGFVRQQMLANSYSCLPVFVDGAWKIVSDSSVARFLGMDASSQGRKERLAMPLEDAAKNAQRLLKDAADAEISPDADLREALNKLEFTEVLLVMDPKKGSSENGNLEERKILGILTAFDLL